MCAPASPGQTAEVPPRARPPVEPDRASQEHRLLRYAREGASPARQGNVSRLVAIDKYPSGRGRKEPCDAGQECRLAGPRAADEHHVLAWLYRECHGLQHAAASGRVCRGRISNHSELAALWPVCRWDLRDSIGRRQFPPGGRSAAHRACKLVREIRDDGEALDGGELAVGLRSVIDQVLSEAREGESVRQGKARRTEGCVLAHGDREEANSQEHPRPEHLEPQGEPPLQRDVEDLGMRVGLDEHRRVLLEPCGLTKCADVHSAIQGFDTETSRRASAAVGRYIRTTLPKTITTAATTGSASGVANRTAARDETSAARQANIEGVDVFGEARDDAPDRQHAERGERRVQHCAQRGRVVAVARVER
eukprot:scaffold1147_cov125-Isochrysis_galbana.AAC.9